MTVLHTVGLLNTVGSILRKSLHVDEISSRSSAYIKTQTWMPSTWQLRPEARSLHIILLTHSYKKENGREHCRRFARLDFCRSCLQLMRSQNTAVYWYHGIFKRCIIVAHFLRIHSANGVITDNGQLERKYVILQSAARTVTKTHRLYRWFLVNAMSIFKRTTQFLNCRGRELYIRILRKCKRPAVVPHLSIVTVVLA